MYKLGSVFSGIGGFELGLERAIPNLETAWQVEIEPFCRKVLKHHWPNSKIYNDITKINTKELESIDMLCGGFPCQDISTANCKAEGLNGKKSGLFWELWGIVRDFREQGRTIPIVVLENVPAITFRGLGDVLTAFSKIGYDAEYFTIRASDFGAPHRRERWFGIFYAAYSPGGRLQSYNKQAFAEKEKISSLERVFYKYRTGENFWQKSKAESPVCSVDDGISNRLARIRALGNAIVPQCSEYVGKLILESGLWEDAVC